MTPSTNIYCNGYVSNGGGIDCTIVSRQGAPAMPRPKSCSGTWGHAFSVEGSGRATMSCGGRPSRVDYSDIASYGRSANFGDIRCTSKRTGLTCRNKSGHGFFLSRRQQKIF
nr:DUF6636 domain-containing protein [Cohaesibacter sp. ES.047]